MCNTYVLYQLCGHTAKYTIISCCKNITSRVNTKVRSLDKNPDHFFHRWERVLDYCPDAPESIHVLPELCDFCVKNGEVGNLLKRNPQAKVDMLMSWKQSLRLEKAKKGIGLDVAKREVEKFGIVGEGTVNGWNEAEFIEFIGLKDLKEHRAVSSSDSSDLTGQSSVGSKTNSSRTSMATKVLQYGSLTPKTAKIEEAQYPMKKP